VNILPGDIVAPEIPARLYVVIDTAKGRDQKYWLMSYLGAPFDLRASTALALKTKVYDSTVKE
jgi:hypothetical protein